MTTETETCAVRGCEWTTAGTLAGSPPPRCGGHGGPSACAMDWLNNDPEDLEPYAEYVAAHPPEKPATSRAWSTPRPGARRHRITP